VAQTAPTQQQRRRQEQARGHPMLTLSRTDTARQACNPATTCSGASTIRPDWARLKRDELE